MRAPQGKSWAPNSHTYRKRGIYERSLVSSVLFSVFVSVRAFRPFSKVSPTRKTGNSCDNQQQASGPPSSHASLTQLYN